MHISDSVSHKYVVLILLTILDVFLPLSAVQRLS